jgi:hypothetical protein
MPYQGMKYTGQIHIPSRTPHGLGTLRSGDGTIWEGMWHFGHLQEDDTSRGTQGEEELLCQRLDQFTTLHDAVSEDSSVSNSIAETIHNDVCTEDDSSSFGSYTAREAKSSSRVLHHKMTEYERYIHHCDETQDYYYEDDSDVSSISRSSSQHQCYQQQQRRENRVSWNENLEERQRRVRFREDP